MAARVIRIADRILGLYIGGTTGNLAGSAGQIRLQMSRQVTRGAACGVRRLGELCNSSRLSHPPLFELAGMNPDLDR